MNSVWWSGSKRAVRQRECMQTSKALIQRIKRKKPVNKLGQQPGSSLHLQLLSELKQLMMLVWLDAWPQDIGVSLTFFGIMKSWTDNQIIQNAVGKSNQVVLIINIHIQKQIVQEGRMVRPNRSVMTTLLHSQQNGSTMATLENIWMLSFCSSWAASPSISWILIVRWVLGNCSAESKTKLRGSSSYSCLLFLQVDLQDKIRSLPSKTVDLCQPLHRLSFFLEVHLVRMFSPGHESRFST